jgi:hypothetical protein
VPEKSLPPNAKTFDHTLIPLKISAFEVIEKAPPSSHKHKQTTSRVMIFFMRFEVFSEIPNPLAQKSNLHFRRSCIGVMSAEILNEDSLLLLQ